MAPAAARASATARRVEARSPASSDRTARRAARPRAAGQRTGQGDPLLLPAGELLGAPVGEGRRQPDQLEQLGRRAPVAALGRGRPKPMLPGHGEVREEVALLRQVADAAPLGRHANPGRDNGAVADPHLTGIRGVEPATTRSRVVLPHPDGTEDGGGRAGLDGQVDAVEHLGGAVGGADAADGEPGHAITVRWRRGARSSAPTAAPWRRRTGRRCRSRASCSPPRSRSPGCGCRWGRAAGWRSARWWSP